MKSMGARLLSAAIGLAAFTFLPSAAWSTEGYFQLGFSPVQNALGGAGVANSEDAMSMALNPAGIVGVGRQFQMGVGLFMPYRGYTGTGTNFVAPGAIESTNNLFLMPNMAYSKPIDADSAVGVVLYGNGGMNTTYKGITNNNAACGLSAGPGAGVFCGGNAGVDLMQAFLSVDYARRMGKLTFGIAPTLAIGARPSRPKGSAQSPTSPATAMTGHMAAACAPVSNTTSRRSSVSVSPARRRCG